ncbi:SPOR domain-containing protein [uncultured Ramlibacter sp.]|uniref:SPOR domain-containing protein n=1 Tax=uncultured Ramlibacter sp. TaxID=260755 RepID=UPI002637B590|nr:SPOR domain-containing protein [uncultured Ramlibacter sp.]
MAFFKFRKGGDDSLSTPSQPESAEAMRRRAKHRLIGAAVLVLVGVVGFPLLFDTQPRPIAVDIPIEIPDRNKAKPLPLPAPAAAPLAASPVVPPPEPVAEQKSAVAPEPTASAAIKTEAKTEPAPAPKPEAKAQPQVAAKPEAKPEAKTESKPVAADDGAKAKALLEGQGVDGASATAAGETRFIVQVGAFADPDKARETRLKVEKAGMKTYTHVAETKEGKRIRVRVGPFATRADADKAASKLKGLDLPAAILTL